MVKHYSKHYAHFSKIVVLFYALNNSELVIFSSMRPLVASGEKPKAFFPLTEIMPFKFEYNSNFDNILLQNSNLVFQPFWQPYFEVTLQSIYLEWSVQLGSNKFGHWHNFHNFSSMPPEQNKNKTRVSAGP